MVVDFGKHLKTGKTLGFDVNRLLDNGKNANILTIGTDQYYKTHGMITKIRQLGKREDTHILVITDHVEDYRNDIMNNNINCLFDTILFHTNPQVTVDAIRKIITVNASSKRRLFIFIDKDYIVEDTELYKLIINLYKNSKKYQYVLNISYKNLALIPDEVLYNSSILELYRISDRFETNIIAYDALTKIIDIQKYNSAKYLGNDEKILSVDRHTIQLYN